MMVLAIFGIISLWRETFSNELHMVLRFSAHRSLNFGRYSTSMVLVEEVEFGLQEEAWRVCCEPDGEEEDGESKEKSRVFFKE